MKNNFSIQEVKDFWDSVFDVYDGINLKIGGSHYQRFTEGLNFLELKNGDRVLNVWSRTGNAVTYINDLAKIELYNLEVSPKMIEIAKKKFPDSNFQITDLEKFDFSNNYFDAVLSLETLEHAPSPEIFLSEVYRVLKPGGRLVMSLPPQTAELPLKIYEQFFNNHGEGPHRFLPSRMVKKILADVGFQLLKHKGTLLIPVGPRFLQLFGERIINLFQNTFIAELGIRQFYICKK